MIFNKSERIRQLERDLEWEKDQRDDLTGKYWDLRRDVVLLVEHLGVSFVDIKKQRVVQKKGGPEKS